jgi:chromosome segregation ATPase
MSVNAVAATELSADNLQSLEEKVYRTIELLKAAREAKANAERDAARLREQLQTREEELETVRSENVGLKRDREEIRGRVEKMMHQIDTIAAEAE